MTALGAPLDPIDVAIEKRRADPHAAVFAVDGQKRDEMVNALIASKRLDPRARTLLPAKSNLAARLAAVSDALAKKVLRVESCGVVSSTAGEVVVQCANRGCPGACQVAKATATFRVRASGWVVEGVASKNVGDTGECGCCL